MMMSEATVMTERIRRPNYGSLELEITIDFHVGSNNDLAAEVLARESSTSQS